MWRHHTYARRVAPKYIVHSYTLRRKHHILHTIIQCLCCSSPPPFFFPSVSGAYLQYGSTRLSDPQPNVTLTVGKTNQRVLCGQNTGPVPTSIRWYNPQGQLVSSNNREEANQQAAGGGRTSTLTFRSYKQSQGGQYECRVAGAGNNLERLPVCIGEATPFYWFKLQIAIVEFFCTRIIHNFKVTACLLINVGICESTFGLCKRVSTG